MALHYFVRIGILGRVGRFAARDALKHPRGARVVCRTSRGLEVGEVLADESYGAANDGDLLRRMTVEDELLASRLEKNKDDAHQACVEMLEDRGIPAILVDVELLFDGQSLYFYFLGEPPPEVEQLTSELADEYEAKVQFRQFTETLTAGCGPDCGTEEAAGGCGAGGCSSCAIATACATKNA